MNKSKSARLHLLKFLFIVPLLGALLVAFRDKVAIHLPTSIRHPATTAVVNTLHTIKNSMLADTTPAGSSPSVISTRKSTPDSLKPIFILDEVEASPDILSKLDPASIGFVSIMKDELVPEFGPRAKNGVVLVYTRKYAPLRKNEILLKDGKKIRLAVPDPLSPGSNSTRPSNSDSSKGPSVLMRPSGVTDYTIDSVHVGNDTYSGQVSGLSFTDSTQPHLEDTTNKFLKRALLIIDGVETSYNYLRIDPDKIGSVTVLKDKAARDQYGAKGKNGVIIVKMKTAASKGQSLEIQSNDSDKFTLTADSIRYRPITGNR